MFPDHPAGYPADPPAGAAEDSQAGGATDRPGDVSADGTAANRTDRAGGSPPPRRALPGRLVWLVWAMVAVAWIVLDQATKILAVAELSDGPIDLPVIDLRLVFNPNAAFGIPGFPGMFLIVGVVVLVIVVRALRSVDRLSLAAVYGLITGGAVGNLIDRVAREPGFPSGHVVDMFDAGWFPVFNVADIGITVGAGLLLIVMWRVEHEERRHAAHQRPPSVRPDTASPRR